MSGVKVCGAILLFGLFLGGIMAFTSGPALEGFHADACGAHRQYCGGN